MTKKKTLLDEYRFPGFRPRAEVKGVFGDGKARVLRLERGQKKLFAVVAALCIGVTTTGRRAGFGICPVAMYGYIWKCNSGGLDATNVAK
jgi:hypothetical protein